MAAGLQPGRVTWRDRLARERAESAFIDYKRALTPPEAAIESARCLHCYDAPCVRACPTEIDIPGFVGRIAAGNLAGAARTVLESNIFGHSCALACPTEVLCEGACVFHSLNEKPIQIGRLQRHAVEEAYRRDLSFFAPGAPTGSRVALVGAGPASLACAHELRVLGHEAVVFEKSPLPGGLNTSGIAPYKMRAETSLAEVDRVLALGVRLETGRELGRDLSLDALLADFDAVFLGLGLGPDSRLGVPGEEHPRVRGAVAWIESLKTGAAGFASPRSALVVGGGNTAIDAARELKWLGVERVALCYRRGEREMSGYRHELKVALHEGVEARYWSVPTRFEGSVDRVRAHLAPTREAAGRLEILAESARAEEFDLVLLAIGQGKLEGLLRGCPGLRFEKGRLVADPRTGETGNPRVFAGGDLVNGGMEIVNAVAEGKRAAHGMHAALAGGLGRERPASSPAREASRG